MNEEPAKLRTERYCTHCRKTTIQNKLIGDTVWICRGCGLELFETGRQKRVSGRWPEHRKDVP